MNLEVLNLFAAVAKTDFQIKSVGAVEIVGGTVQGNQNRHLGRKTFLHISSLQRAALDRHFAVRRRNKQTNRRQRTRCAVGPDIGVGGDAHILAGHRLDVAYGVVGLRPGSEAEAAQN